MQASIEDRGHTDVLVDREHITAIQDLLNQKISLGETLNHRAKIVAASAGCGGRPPEPPRPPDNPEPPGGKPPGPPTPDLKRARVIRRGK
jgi:hypothetical protein